jgi:hypothetical protein
MRKCTAIVVLVCLFLMALGPGPQAQAQKARTLEDDLKSLQGGVWWMSPPRCWFGLSFHVGPSDKVASFRLGGPGDFTPSSLTFELKQKGKKRYILFEEKPLNTGPKAIFARSVVYRFDGKRLVLVVEEGKLKGEYKLVRKKK